MTYISSEVRVRFAPSPTGHLHIGGLRSALFNWLFAKHNNGVFLIRIEDTDVERSTQEYTNSILNTFTWLHIAPDEPIVIQSQRINEHRMVIQKLLEEKKAYRCYCSPTDLSERLDKKAGENTFVPYDRYCLQEDRNYDITRPHVIRFKIPDDIQEIVFNDIIRDTIVFAIDQLDDFIIVRSDGLPVYNLVVVLDDAYMNITHVIRGEEHIPNTPKQILLYQACNYHVPQFAHLPVILGSDGSKLSKRDGATSVMEYKAAGYLPNALINYLARLGWSHQDQEIFSRAELIDFFSLENVGKKGAIFDKEKLNWINSVYIKNSHDSQLKEDIIDAIDPHLYATVSGWDGATIDSVIGLYKERIKTLVELHQELVLLHNGPTHFVPHDYNEWVTPQARTHIQELIVYMSNARVAQASTADMVKQFAKDKNIKLVTIAQPLRIALLGKAAGPGIFSLLELVSLPEVIHRLQKLIAVTMPKADK